MSGHWKQDHWTPEGIAAIIDQGTVREDDDGRAIFDVMTCGECGRSWDDARITSITPTPSGRCPFEFFHGESA